jgi:hypothetical protein
MKSDMLSVELKDHQPEDLQSVGESSAAVLPSLLFCTPLSMALSNFYP